MTALPKQDPVEPASSTEATSAAVEEQARWRIAEDGKYAYYFRDITVSCAGRVLILRGRVPTFHAKQILQTLLRGLDGVDAIENRVDVANSAGLSSIRPR